ncbi:MAG: glycosyl hydrolase family 8 [Candidatus Dormibacteria bacterium]
MSEGQAYGMLLAELAGKPAIALQIWTWTKAHLLQPDGLLAYHATANGTILSSQSATDADTLVAYGLLRYQGLDAASLHAAGRALAAAVLKDEAVTGPAGALLPTAGPWANGPPSTLDPSYWMPGVYLALARYTGNEAWDGAAAQAISLVTELTAGGGLLPPDWAQLQGTSVQPIAAPGGGAPIQYGLDAARIPVFLAASCAAGARRLAARWWQGYFAAGGAEDSSIALSTSGAMINADTNPLPYLASAATAFAAGDRGAANQLLGQAQAEALQFPTYYGDAWMALAPALLEGMLAPC